MDRIEETDNFITICCDGIFDVMTNEEVVNYFLKRIPYKRHLKDLCEDLADYCCHKVSSGTINFRKIHQTCIGCSPMHLKNI